jgi:heme/copper-type cytochrome/quinol oxidase subunit 2
MTMRSSWLPFSLTVTATLFLASSGIANPANLPASATENVQVIEVTAKKYEFNPSPIRVKQGTRVQLKITATDHAHGFKIRRWPDEAAANGDPGLLFSSPEDCQKIEKGQTETVEFVARTAGTYSFRCCTRCGLHHRGMQGQLIVEP